MGRAGGFTFCKISEEEWWNEKTTGSAEVVELDSEFVDYIISM